VRPYRARDGESKETTMTRAIFCNVAALAILAAVTVPASAAMKPAALGSSISPGVIQVQGQGQGQMQDQGQEEGQGQPGQKQGKAARGKKRGGGGKGQGGMMQKIKKNMPAEYQQYLGGAGGAGGMGGMGGPQ
jgi:hypothetical protein